MDIFLVIAGVLLLLFGILLIVFPGKVKKISDFLNTSILPIEDKMQSSHMVSGIMLLVLGIVIFYMAFKK